MDWTVASPSGCALADVVRGPAARVFARRSRRATLARSFERGELRGPQRDRARGADRGRVILAGSDERERRALAPSVTEPVRGAADTLDPEEPRRYDIGADERGRHGYFDMHRTSVPPVPPSADEMAERTAVGERRNAAFRADRSAFAEWLAASAKASATRSSTVSVRRAG